MRFSLIISTLERVRELERLLESLAAQTCQDFEILLCDQNRDNRLGHLAALPAWAGRLRWIRSSGGVSRGRNAGLETARGEIVAFPDDDCYYPPDLLERVGRFFDERPRMDLLSGSSMAEDGGAAVSRHATRAGPIAKGTIHTQCIEFALFIRRRTLGTMRFDENLGVGAATPWQSDEGPDLILRLQALGAEAWYDPAFVAGHPRPIVAYDARAIDRSYRYACGTGYFLRLHGYSAPYFYRMQARTLAGLILAGVTLQIGRARFYAARLRGRHRGWTYRPPAGTENAT